MSDAAFLHLLFLPLLLVFFLLFPSPASAAHPPPTPAPRIPFLTPLNRTCNLLFASERIPIIPQPPHTSDCSSLRMSIIPPKAQHALAVSSSKNPCYPTPIPETSGPHKVNIKLHIPASTGPGTPVVSHTRIKYSACCRWGMTQINFRVCLEVSSSIVPRSPGNASTICTGSALHSVRVHIFSSHSLTLKGMFF